MQEILNAPDSIPQSVLNKANCVVILPSVLKFCHRHRRQLRARRDDLPRRQDFHGPWGAPTMMALEGGSAGYDSAAMPPISFC